MRTITTLLLLAIALKCNAQFDYYLPNDTTNKPAPINLKYDAETYRIKSKNSFLFASFTAIAGGALQYVQFRHDLKYINTDQHTNIFLTGAYCSYGISVLAVVNGAIRRSQYNEARKNKKISLVLNTKEIGIVYNL